MFHVALLITVASFIFSFTEHHADAKQYKVVCYLGSWANYRTGRGKFLIEDIDPFLCTHLIYSFAKLGSDNRIAAYDPYLDVKENWGLGAYQRFNDLRKKNPQLKTILAIGGWNEGSTKYSKMAATPANRKVFVESCVKFLKNYGFDGLDMDWEYPANRGGTPQDKQNFINLLKELKDAFANQNLLLTAAVSAGKNTIDTAYDIPAMSKYLDLINIMTYDFHGGWDKFTGINSPLYAKSSETADQKTLNTDYAINYWIKKGAPKDKIILGMGLYGRSFTLKNPKNHGIGAPINGKGTAGPYTREPGFLGYNEICEKLKPANHNWTYVFDSDHKTPYIFKGNQWIGYDNIESIKLKVDYIKSKNLAGGMVWSIETDDFRNYCERGRYPLITTIAEGLNGPEGRKETSPSSTITTAKRIESSTLSSTEKKTESSTLSSTEKQTQSSSKSSTVPLYSTIPVVYTSPSDSVCHQEGYIRDPNDCTKFYYCKAKEPTGFYVYEYNCGPGTVYSQDIVACVFPSDVPECKNEIL